MALTMAHDRLSIRNDPADLRAMSVWLEKFGNEAALPHDIRFALDLCANEAVANIIDHAFGDAMPHSITLELRSLEHGARLTITDDGRPFDMVNAPSPELPGNLSEARIGGLGIHLIRQLASHLEYTRQDNCNILHLEFDERHHSRTGQSRP